MKKSVYMGVVASVMMGLAGCSDWHSTSDRTTPSSIDVEASSREIVSGETVTLTARTRETYGRNADVRWSTTAGTLRTEQDGRIARVKFDEAGTYTVKAVLMVDGREVQSDMVEVRVRPVN